MKKPLEPPEPEGLRNRLLAHPDYPTIIQATIVVSRNDDRYFTWDDLRHRPLPEGLPSHELWWGALQWLRMAGRQPTPLRDRAGQPFSYLITDAIHQSLHEIDMNLGGAIAVPDEPPGSEHLDRYLISTLMEEAITSSQLEGAVTTRLVAKEMLRTGRAPLNHPERMIRNNYRVMQKIGELRQQPIGPDLIFALHRIATEDTLEDPTAAGRLRNASEDVAVRDAVTGELFHAPPPAGQLADRMETMCRFANGTLPGQPFVHPVIRAIVLHFWLAYDHPFVDGNGRTARALFYWSMLRQQYTLFEYLSISRMIRRSSAQYYRAFLHTETDQNDLTYFILYHLRVIHLAKQELHQFIERKTREIREAEDRLRGMRALNHRQRALITHALKHPNQRYTVQSHRRSHGVVYETARKDLLDLQQRGYLWSQLIGRTLNFQPSAELEARLRDAPA